MRRRGASLRRTMALVLALMTFWSMSLPASARPSDDSQPVPLDLADRDGDRVSDGLTADLKNRGPNERVDVVVTWTRRPDIEASRRAAGHFDVTAQFSVINGFAASLNAGQIRALSKVPGVFRVEEDFQVSILNDEANADFGTSRARTDFPATGAGAGVVFCVVDTGVDRTHEQLDGNKVVAWRDVISGQLTAYDDQGHGTHVASTLGGDGVGGPDASRYQGVAPGVSIAAVKVLDSAGNGSESQVIQGIDWCIAQQVDGISMSLGDPALTDGNDGLSQAVDRAVLDHGIVSVIAAGNSGDGPGTVGSPGAARQAITVGAATKVADGLRLAGFSSRGPTLDGRLKPDVVSPGVAITAANANTGSGYFAASGTSMATPFTAGVVALMLGCNGLLTPSQIKSALGSTATDLGPAGADNNWGNGLIDGYEAVASACGGSGGMALPTHNHVQGTVPNGGTYTYRFTVGTDGLGKPISATILIQGQLVCTFEFWGMCFIWEWSPDIEARLVGPANNELWINECPARGECGTVGQTEVITATASQAGEYRIEIWAVTDPPNNGLGGGFVMDLFYGPVGGAPPPANGSPVAGNDAYPTSEDTPLSVPSPGVLGNDSDPDGDTLTAAVVTDPTSGTLVLNPDGSFSYTANPNFNGADSFVYRASDGRGGTSQGNVTLTVSAVNDPPVANAGPDQTLTDTDGSGGELVTLNGTGSTDLDGDSLSYSWTDGAQLWTEPSPVVSLTVGTHILTLTVNDGSASATDTGTITVQPQPSPSNNPPVAINDSYSTNEDTLLSVPSPGVLGVLGNDSDIDPGDVLTSAVVTSPTAGSLAFNADGSFIYTPNPNFNGVDSFVYHASDGKGGTSQATVTLTVSAVNDPPVASAGPDQTVTDTDGNGSQGVTLNGTGSTDPDGDSLTYSWSEGATVLGTGPSLSVSLTEGTHTVTLTVNDGSASATDTVTITVQPQQPPYTTIHVADLDRTSTWNARRTKWTATVTVRVHNAGHILVSGAKVSFSLSDGTTRSCTTDTNGACVVSKDKAANVSSLTFTVTNLTRNGQTYAPGSNHDPDLNGDSNGTATTATRPS